MAAHEWTRARQRSVRGTGAPSPQPRQPEPEPRPEEKPEPEAEHASAEETASEMAEPAVDVPVSEPTEPLVVEPGPESEAPPQMDEAVPEAPEPHEDAEPEEARSPAPLGPGQALLPLGLDPLPEKQQKRSATESREELIQRLLDPHLTLQETAKLLDVCPTTVRRYTNRGLLAHYRTPGNQRRFRLSDVLAFMERQGIPALGLERKGPPGVAGPLDDAENAT